MPVPDGSLYWRLVDSAKKPLSVYRRFHVHGVHALRAESPSGPAVSWDDAVDFQWSHDAGSLPELGSHWIEISGDAAFASLLQKPQIPAHSLRASIRGLPEGRYFWRVASRYGTLTILGPSREFHVRKGQQLAIDPLAPRDAAVVQAGQQLLFEWEANARQADFTLDLEGPPGAARSVETRQKMVAVPDLMVGNYRWRIFGHVGGMQAETPWRRFRILQPGPIALVSPRSGSNIEVAAAGVPVTFDWTRSESPATSEYVLEVASDPEFQRIVGFKRSRTPRTTSAEFNLSADRDYFWRVAVLGPEGLAQALSASSSFRYSIYKGLPAPGDLLPQDGVTCNPLKSKEPCTYSWSEVSGAALYEIEFFNADPGGRAPASSESMRPALRKTVAESSFRTRSLAEGSYYWRVRARDRSGRPGAASPLRRFQLNLGRRLSAPRGRSSEVQ